MSTYVYTINSIGIDVVYFASKRAALNYAIKHNIKCSDGKIRIHRVNPVIAYLVRKDFNECKLLQKP